jgi:hypothetical protein
MVQPDLLPETYERFARNGSPVVDTPNLRSLELFEAYSVQSIQVNTMEDKRK